MAEVVPQGAERALTPHLTEVLQFALEHGASDVHLALGVAPVVRIDGALRSVPGKAAYDLQAIAADVLSSLTASQQTELSTSRELDFSFPFSTIRLRANVFYERGQLGAAYRLIPAEIRSAEQIGLPAIATQFLERRQGLLIIAGPTGHGKSTTLAALVDHINVNRSEHIVTIEDPIEYVFQHKKSVVVQREVESDTRSFAAALRSAVRQDPNVLLIGEMRDQETMDAALTLAETGHLILTTLHTSSAAQTADRIIDSFPPHQQQQIRAQLAATLIGIVSQRLIPRVNGGRVLAAEVLVANTAVRTSIREGKTHQIDNLIQTGASEGMVGLDTVLGHFVSQGEITIDDALVWANDPNQLKTVVY